MGAISSILGLLPGAAQAAGAGATSAVGGAGAAGATGNAAAAGQANGQFGNSMASALDGLNASQNNASDLAVKAATGDLTDVHNYTIAAAEANLATEFTVQMRNRVVETFNEIMRMQI